MRHVDEGTIHAWLDAQITDPGETAWIEEHLRWCAACGARLAEERSTLERAHALLSVAAPSSEPPAFGELMAKAGHTAPDVQATSLAPLAHGRRWLLQAGWAASLALAIGIGWTARELADREPQRSSAAPPVTETAAASSANPADSAASRRADPGTSTPGTRVVSNAPVDRPAAAQLPSRQRPAPATTARVPEPIGVAASLPPAADAQARSAFREPDRSGGVPAAASREASAPPAAVPVPVSPPPLQERISIAAEPRASALLTTQISEFRTLARTEAAVRSGMPLYGIDGLEPMLTTISADGRVVRTVYRLESGDSVVLEQQRAMPDAAPTVASVQAGGAALTSRGGGGINADVAAAAQRVWFGVRGDMRVTLRTTSGAADLDALGTKLRVD